MTGQRTAREGQQFSPLPHGTSRNQPDASPHAILAATVGPGSGRPHSTPTPSRSQWLSAPCTRPLCRAGRAKRLPQTQQLSGVPCPHTLPHLLVTSMCLGPTQIILSRGWSSGSREKCCPLWSHQAGPVLTLTPQWKAAQLPLLLFVFKGELNTLTKQETQSQHQPRLNHSHTWQCTVLLSPSWVGPEHSVATSDMLTSLRLSPPTRQHSCP